jgi:hypothetical protein
MLIVKNPRNLEIHPLPGKRLPTDWEHQAAVRAAEADQNYTSAIENAWRQPLGKQVTNPGRAARLTNDSRSDSRSDRMDSALRLIAEDERWELWQDSHGRTVRRRKNGTVQ